MSFDKNLYEVVRGAIPKELAENLDIEFDLIKKLKFAKNPETPKNKYMFGDELVEKSFSSYAPLCFEALSLQLQPLMEKITGKALYPTYTYARVYHTGATMQKHKDRPSCEYSISICISVDPEPWTIWFEDLEGNELAVDLEPGDLVVYKGEILSHWRNEYTGKRQTQAFLHYVDRRGKHQTHRFDGRSHLGLPKDVRIGYVD